MKRNLIFAILLFSINCFSQIEIERPVKEIKNEIIIPKLNDTIDLKGYRSAEDFLGLINHELIYLPENKKHGSFYYDFISYLPREKFKFNKKKYKKGKLISFKWGDSRFFKHLEIEGAYFRVDSIQFFNSDYTSRMRITPIKFNELQKGKSSLYSCADVYTTHKKNNKIIVFQISGSIYSDRLMTVPYFKHLQSKYLNRKIILKKSGRGNYSENYELERFNREYLDSAQIYNIRKIVLKEPNSEYTYYYTPFFTLENLNSIKEEKEFYNIKEKIIFYDDFITGANLREKRESIKRDSLERVDVSEKVIAQKEKETRLKKMINKYGKEYGKLIAEKSVITGMTKQMCIDSWGKPKSINKTTTAYEISEQWVYGSGSYLYFDDGKLTTIQN